MEDSYKPHEKRHYVEIKALDRSAIDEILSRDDPEEIYVAVLSAALYGDDFAWVHQLCVRMSSHWSAKVRGNAVTGFGHLARRFRRLEMPVVESIYRSALEDRDAFVREQARDMLDDICFYLKTSPSWPY